MSLYPQREVVFTPYQKNLLFATDGDYYRKLQQIKYIESRSTVPVDTTTQHPHLRHRKHCRKWWKVCQGQKIRDFALRLCLLVISEGKASPTWSPKYELNKDTNMHAKPHREKPSRPQPCTENYRHAVKLEAGEAALPREEHTNWLPNAKGSALKTYTKARVYESDGLYLGF